MATPPTPLVLRVEAMGGDVPEWARIMFEQLNAFAAQTSEALAGGITRGENLQASEKVGLVFTTEATAADTFPIKVKHGLATTPKHVECGKLERDDGAAITAAWSMTWEAASGGQINVTFQGLSNSVKYRANFTFE